MKYIIMSKAHHNGRDFLSLQPPKATKNNFFEKKEIKL